MKNVVALHLALLAHLLFSTCCLGQSTSEGPQSSSVAVSRTVVANTKADSLKPTAKDDVVVNKDMLASFRRCYDSIQTSTYAQMFGGYRADDMSIALLVAQKVKNEEMAPVPTEPAKIALVENQGSAFRK